MPSRYQISIFWCVYPYKDDLPEHFVKKPLPKNAKCPLPVGVRRSKGRRCESEFFNVCVDNLFVNISYKLTAVMFGLLDWK